MSNEHTCYATQNRKRCIVQKDVTLHFPWNETPGIINLDGLVEDPYICGLLSNHLIQINNNKKT